MAAMIFKSKKCFGGIRKREDRRDEYDTAWCLHSQALGTRRCLKNLKATGTDIPQETIDVFSSQEKHYERETSRLDVGEIPEEDLHLSPLVLESKFLVKEILAQIDHLGSNADLIDSEAAAALRTPSGSRGTLSGSQPKESSVLAETSAMNDTACTGSTSVPPDQVLEREGILEISDSSTRVEDKETRSFGGQEQETSVIPPRRPSVETWARKGWSNPPSAN